VSEIEDKSTSKSHYQLALKYAGMVDNTVGQSLALGNMTALSPYIFISEIEREEDERMGEMADKYLDLCSEIKNKRAEEVAHIQKGKICIIEKDYDKSINSFKNALKVAKAVDNTKGYNEAKCCFGFSRGQRTLKDHFRKILNSIPKDDNKF